MPELSDAPFVNFFDPDFREHAPEIMERVRDQAPLVQTPVGCLVHGRSNVHDLLLDPRLRASVLFVVEMQGVTEGPLHDLVASTVLELDGPDHSRLRRLVTPALTPKAAAVHRPLMRDITERLVDGFAAAGRCEFMGDFADHYPIEVMCHLLGVPPEDHERFARWNDAMTWVLSFELSARLDEVHAAFEGLFSYIDDLIADRRRSPRDDLVSQLIGARDGADRLTELELRAMIGALLFAGYDTTRNQLGVAMWVFADHPDQWALLSEQPELAPAAVEELMRSFGVVSVVPRLAREDIDLDGWRIPAGTFVGLSLGGANHDPAVYDDPYRFDITAHREGHLTFGGGPHHCLGANLARAEMQEALPVLARRLPGLALDGEPEWRGMSGIFGTDRLPLTFTPTSA